MGIIALIAGNPIGRKLLVFGAIALTAMIVVGKIFSAGRAKERLKQMQHTIKVQKIALQTDQELSGLTRAERRERLREWATD